MMRGRPGSAAYDEASRMGQQSDFGAGPEHDLKVGLLRPGVKPRARGDHLGFGLCAGGISAYRGGDLRRRRA